MRWIIWQQKKIKMEEVHKDVPLNFIQLIQHLHFARMVAIEESGLNLKPDQISGTQCSLSQSETAICRFSFIFYSSREMDLRCCSCS